MWMGQRARRIHALYGGLGGGLGNPWGKVLGLLGRVGKCLRRLREAWGGLTLSEVSLGGGPFGGIFSGTGPLKKSVVEFIHGAGVHCEV